MNAVNLDLTLLSSGTEFQALCSFLLAFEEPDVRPSTKNGQDGAIDALSRDGLTVYQFKFHRNGGVKDCIRDARAELDSIKSHKVRDDRYSQIWSTVRNWILITNVKMNESDLGQWRSNVSQIFGEEELAAEIWDGTRVETLLLKHPHLIGIFFGGEPRPFRLPV